MTGDNSRHYQSSPSQPAQFHQPAERAGQPNQIRPAEPAGQPGQFHQQTEVPASQLGDVVEDGLRLPSNINNNNVVAGKKEVNKKPESMNIQVQTKSKG